MQIILLRKEILMKILMTLLAALTLGTLALTPARADNSKPVQWSGSIELRSPVWNSETNGTRNLDNLELAGDLKVQNLLPGKSVLWVKGEHTFHQANLYKPENKLKVGIDVPMARDWTFFTYWDRRFQPSSGFKDTDVDRVFVGVRLNFRGSCKN